MSMAPFQKPPLAVVFGGSGFIGRHVVRRLAKSGWRVRAACRRPDLAFHLQPLGRVGQIQVVQANVRYPASLAAAVTGADVVINLTGILTQSGRQNFDAVHAFGSGAIARAARAAGATRFIQMSAIGADAQSDSVYARSKAQGEAAVSDAFPGAIIIRPSIVFGPEDGFFNRFAAIARMSPVLPAFGDGKALFQPVYVGDVAEAVTRLAALSGAEGKIFELGGPERKSFTELMHFVSEVTGRKRVVVPVPLPVARIQAFCLSWLNKLSFGIWPDWLTVTPDQVRLLQRDNIVSDAAISEGRDLLALGIKPESMETIVPTYLYRFRKTGQFEMEKPA